MAFIWHTQLDDRVRPSHAAREGLIFDDSYTPKPGDEYNCRCWAEKVSQPDIGESDILGFGSKLLNTTMMSTVIGTAIGLGKNYLPKSKTMAGVPNSLIITLGLTGYHLLNQEDHSKEQIAQTVGIAAVMYAASTLAGRFLPGQAKLIGFGLRIGLNLFLGMSHTDILASELGRYAGSKIAGKLTGSIIGAITTTTTAKVTRPVSVQLTTTKPVSVPGGQSPPPTRGRPPYSNIPYTIGRVQDLLTRAAGTPQPFKLGGNTRLTKNTEKIIETKLQNLESARSIEEPTYRAGLGGVYRVGKYGIMYPQTQKPLTGELNPVSEKGLKNLAGSLNKQLVTEGRTVEDAQKATVALFTGILTKKKPGQIF